jgi:NAD(P)-dependent dehydrogenase (short-subunit alcohol dehydrogenase family)
MEMRSTLDLQGVRGRRVVITGATSGVGRAVAHELAALGADFVVAARRSRRADAAIDELRAAGAAVDVVPLDLADLESVTNCVNGLRSRLPVLDVLIADAGVNLLDGTLTPSGLETQFAVNHLGHFALALGLLPNLTAGTDSRVVVVGSEAHRRAALPPSRRADPRGYENSKLANLLFAFELDRRLRDVGSPVQSVVCHPGFIQSGMTDDLAAQMPEGHAKAFKAAVAEHAWAPSEGARTVLYSAFSRELQGGEYVEPTGHRDDPRPRPVAPAETALDRSLAHQLWSLSEELTGVGLPGREARSRS